MRILILFIIIAIFTLLYYSTRSSAASATEQSSSTEKQSSFYTKTKDALDAKGVASDKSNQEKYEKGKGKQVAVEGNGGNGDGGVGKMGEEGRERKERLKEAEALAKGRANAKSPNKPENPEDLVGVGNSADGSGKEKGVAGRKKYSVGNGGEGGQQVVKGDGEEGEDEEVVETPERRAARTELGLILKKAPSEFSFPVSSIIPIPSYHH